MEIHRREGPGDVLVFLTGEDEIETAVKMLREAARDDARRLAGAGGRNGAGEARAFRRASALRWAQHRAADGGVPTRAGHTQDLVASNVAETSVTIEGWFTSWIAVL